jgi:hypothetical protein
VQKALFEKVSLRRLFEASEDLHKAHEEACNKETRNKEARLYRSRTCGLHRLPSQLLRRISSCGDGKSNSCVARTASFLRVKGEPMAHDRTTRGVGAHDRTTRGLKGLGACGCPRGSYKINAKKSGFRCFSNSTGKLVKQSKRRKAGEACWPAKRRRSRRKRKG